MSIRVVLLATASLLAGPAAAETYTLGLKGLACPYCAYGVEKRLSAVDGVTDVEVDVVNSFAIVRTRDGVTLTRPQAHTAVEEAGFTLDTFEQTTAEDDQADAR